MSAKRARTTKPRKPKTPPGPKPFQTGTASPSAEPVPTGFVAVPPLQQLSEDAERIRALLHWAQRAVWASCWFGNTQCNGIPNEGEGVGVAAALGLAVSELARISEELEKMADAA